MFLRCATCTKPSKYSNCTVNSSNTAVSNIYLEEIHFHCQCHTKFVTLIRQRQYFINACDPVQNQGQNKMFYKAGHTRLTRTKCSPDNQTQFQSWPIPSHITIYIAIGPITIGTFSSYLQDICLLNLLHITSLLVYCSCLPIIII